MRSLTALPPTRGDSVLTAAPRKSKKASGSKQCRAHGSHRSSASGFTKAAGMAGERSVEACMTKMSQLIFFLNTMHKFCSNNIKRTITFIQCLDITTDNCSIKKTENAKHELMIICPKQTQANSANRDANHN